MDTLKLDNLKRGSIVALVLGDLGESKYAIPLTKEEKRRGDALDAWLGKWLKDGNPEPDEHQYRDAILSMAEEVIREE